MPGSLGRVGLVFRACVFERRKGKGAFFDFKKAREGGYINAPAMRVIELSNKAYIGEVGAVPKAEGRALGQQGLVGGKPLGHPMVEPFKLAVRGQPLIGLEV